jgi:hypothetical protein
VTPNAPAEDREDHDVLGTFACEEAHCPVLGLRRGSTRSMSHDKPEPIAKRGPVPGYRLLAEHRHLRERIRGSLPVRGRGSRHLRQRGISTRCRGCKPITNDTVYEAHHHPERAPAPCEEQHARQSCVGRFQTGLATPYFSCDAVKRPHLGAPPGPRSAP